MFKLNMPANSDHISGTDSIEKKIVFITCLFWLIAKIISWKVWTGYRLFPLVPMFGFLRDLPLIYHSILFLVSIFCLILLLIKPITKVTVVLIIAELLSLIADQTRWQPWEYQYLFIVLLFWLNRKKSRLFYSSTIFVIAAIYFYSGIGKLNPGFLFSVWNEMIVHRFLKLDTITADNRIFYYAGYLIGLVEMLSAIGLIFKPLKKISAILLILMHCFNLLVLGPFGINYNIIIWPWNIAMIAYLYVLLVATPRTAFCWKHLTTGWNKIVLIFWGLLPIFYFFGWWDTYLSSMMYTGNVKHMIICVKDSNEVTTKSLRPFYGNDYKDVCNGDATINVTRWAIKELKVPVYPEKRVYLKIKESFIKTYPAAQFNVYLFTYYMNKREELK
jgi:hypothetical protein